MTKHSWYTTIPFADMPHTGMSVQPTMQDEEMLIRQLPKPKSWVDCWVPSQLLLPSKRPSAVVRRLDVSGAVLYVEHAVPDEVPFSAVTLTLPQLGRVKVPARVVRALNRSADACWIAEVKFQVDRLDLRRDLAKLMAALRFQNEQRGAKAAP